MWTFIQCPCGYCCLSPIITPYTRQGGGVVRREEWRGSQDEDDGGAA